MTKDIKFSVTLIMEKKMKSIQPLIIMLSVCLATTAANIDMLELAAKVDMLSNELMQLKEQNAELKIEIQELMNTESDLKTRMSKIEVREENALSSVFDCYLTSNWTTAGPIKFNGCSGIIIYY